MSINKNKNIYSKLIKFGFPHLNRLKPEVDGNVFQRAFIDVRTTNITFKLLCLLKLYKCIVFILLIIYLFSKSILHVMPGHSVNILSILYDVHTLSISENKIFMRYNSGAIWIIYIKCIYFWFLYTYPIRKKLQTLSASIINQNKTKYLKILFFCKVFLANLFLHFLRLLALRWMCVCECECEFACVFLGMCWFSFSSKERDTVLQI